jgi:hypothetical protein
MNWILAIAVILTVATFKLSAALAGAYGVAVGGGDDTGERRCTALALAGLGRTLP